MDEAGLGFIQHQIQRLTAARLECPLNDGEREKYEALLRTECDLLKAHALRLLDRM